MSKTDKAALTVIFQNLLCMFSVTVVLYSSCHTCIAAERGHFKDDCLQHMVSTNYSYICWKIQSEKLLILVVNRTIFLETLKKYLYKLSVPICTLAVTVLGCHMSQLYGKSDETSWFSFRISFDIIFNDLKREKKSLKKEPMTTMKSVISKCNTLTTDLPHVSPETPHLYVFLYFI